MLHLIVGFDSGRVVVASWDGPITDADREVVRQQMIKIERWRNEMGCKPKILLDGSLGQVDGLPANFFDGFDGEE